MICEGSFWGGTSLNQRAAFAGTFATIFGLHVAAALGNEQSAIGLLLGLGLLSGSPSHR